MRISKLSVACVWVDSRFSHASRYAGGVLKPRAIIHTDQQRHLRSSNLAAADTLSRPLLWPFQVLGCSFVRSMSLEHFRRVRTSLVGIRRPQAYWQVRRGTHQALLRPLIEPIAWPILRASTTPTPGDFHHARVPVFLGRRTLLRCSQSVAFSFGPPQSGTPMPEGSTLSDSFKRSRLGSFHAH